MKKTGSIPTNLKFYCQGETIARFKWDDIDAQGVEHKVLPTMVSDAKNPKRCETAAAWASNSRYGGKKDKFVIIERENKPMTDIKLLSLEIRGQGGRAWKVVIEGRYYVDLREDVLLDLLIHEGVSKGGNLIGQYIWAIVGAEMKLVRVGSKLHESMIEATELDNQKVLDCLFVGDLVENKKGDRFVYLGDFYTRDIIINSGSTYPYRDRVSGLKKSEKVQVFFELPSWDKDPFAKESYICHKATKTKKHSFKKKVGTMQFPSDLVKRIRDSASVVSVGDTSYGWQANLSEEEGYISPRFKQFA